MHSWNVLSPLTRRDGLRARKPKYAAARAFFITIFVITGLLLWSLFISSGSGKSNVVRRAVSLEGSWVRRASFATRDQQCRLVHAANDQCAFVRINCPDEDAGLFSYLQFYYCRLSKAKPIAFIALVIWLGFLFSTIGIAASDFFCINLSTIAHTLNLSDTLAGVTLLALGNGSPDVFSTFAAMKSHSGSLAIGELIGAAGLITAVVAGSIALVRPFKVAKKSFVRDIGFFIVAASFSMVFLADGHLALWECGVMVGFYIFYVVTVVIWHWYQHRTSHRRILEDEARSHFHVPGTDEDPFEPYRDDEGVAASLSRRPSTRAVSIDDFANLERASPTFKAAGLDTDEGDDIRDRFMARINGNMRVSRPARSRKNTLNPIRPSLVGALEFRAVLSSLEKSRNLQTTPINLRRYSDDPTLTAMPAASDDIVSTSSNLSTEGHRIGPNRARAVSANDASGSHQTFQQSRALGIGQRQLSPPRGTGLKTSRDEEQIDAWPVKARQMPSLSIPDCDSEQGYLAQSPLPMSPLERRESTDLLAPPHEELLRRDDGDERRIHSPGGDTGSSLQSGGGSAQPTVPRIHIPRSSTSSHQSSSLSPFPAYQDDPGFVPSSSRLQSAQVLPTSAGSDSTFRRRLSQGDRKRMKCWPYRILSPPQYLISTLFPTLYSWKEKNVWEIFLGFVAAPSIFLLAVTLPVVEIDRDEEDDLPSPVDPDLDLLSPKTNLHQDSSHGLALPQNAIADTGDDHGGSHSSTIREPSKTSINSPSINITAPSNGNNSPPLQIFVHADTSRPQDQSSTLRSSPKDWNRWLVATQLFTGPFFVVLLIWANTDSNLSIRNLILPSLYALIGSLVAFALLLVFTSPSQPPKYRYLLCYLGFIVAIAWISTIANEVVGVLKALGIILNISDAILGLTIFAVGNSLGDLVANITVARLGYPVMALSACFGGPMLNILLGIGVSGLYLTIQGAERREEKHPGRPFRYKPYEIEVGGTLLISGVTLLITLVGLLVVVPLRGWWMDRKVGLGLVILWTLSTIGNVIVEVVGWDIES